MDFFTLRSELDDLRHSGDSLLKQLSDLDQDKLANSEALLDQFLSQVEELVMQAEKKSYENAKKQAALKKFLRIVPPSGAEDQMEAHKAVAASYFNGMAETSKPFQLFVALVEEPGLELSSEDFDLIDDFFGRAITRPLYQGKYSFEEKAEGDRKAEVAPPPKQDGALESSYTVDEGFADEEETLDEEPSLVDQFEITTQKENATFSVKAFLNDYTRDKSAWLSRGGELQLLCMLARFGALTLLQIENYVYNEEITNRHFERLLKNGFLTMIVHKPSGETFFALSGNGAEAFNKKKCRDLMSDFGNVPTEVLDYENCLVKIDFNEVAYRDITTVGLHIYRACLEYTMDLDDVDVDQITANECLTIIILQLTRDGDTGWLMIIYDADGAGVFAINSSYIDQSKPSFAMPNPNDPHVKLYDCQITDDPLRVRFFDETEGEIELEELIDNMFMPAVETDGGAVPSGKRRSCELAEEPAKDEGENDPFQLAENMLRQGVALTDHTAINTLVTALLHKAATEENDALYLGRAVVLLKALSMADKALYGDDYLRLILATDFPSDNRTYTGEVLSALFDGMFQGSAAHLAALFRTLFAPDSEYEYLLPSYAENLFEHYDEIFTDMPALKSMLNAFLEIYDASREGFSDKVISHLMDGRSKDEVFRQMSAEATRLIAPPRINQRLSGLPEMLAACFGPGSAFGACMKAIAESDVSERDHVSEIYDEFRDGDRISQVNIKAVFDETWRKIRTRHMIHEIVGAARDRLLDAFEERLELMNHWLISTEGNGSAIAPHLPRVYANIRSELHSGLESLSNDVTMPGEDRAILKRALANMLAKLEGAKLEGFVRDDWLAVGVLPVTTGGVPELDDASAHVKYYEPWRNVLRHISHKPQPLAEVLDRIETDGDPLYDNLGQAVLICEVLGLDERAELYRKSDENARQAGENLLKEFLWALELDFAYGRVGEKSREAALSALDSLKSDFWETSDFARFRIFLESLRRMLDEEIEENRSYWMAAIQRRRETDSGSGFTAFLDRAEQFLGDSNANFIFVEESLNNFDSKADPDQGDLISDEANAFLEFIDDANYHDLSDVCRKHKGSAFRDFAPKYAKCLVEKAGLSSKYIRSAQKLIESLPNNPQDNSSENIKILLEELGFQVISVTRDNPDASPSWFTVQMTPDQKNRSNYKHPIADLGTRLPGELRVMELFGNFEPGSIISEVQKADARHMPIVFLNGSLTLAQRRQLAKLFLKDGNAQNPFILIDWVLLLHLSSKAPEERLRVMLACALPYTGVRQLFSMTSTTPVADEMYMGRTGEISRILDMNGPVIVYGGRQLGKTALLRRVKNLFHAPEKNDYGVFVDEVKNSHDEHSFVMLTVKALREAGVDVPDTVSVSGLCDELQKWLRHSNRRLLLLIDESDNLLAELSKTDYAPLNSLETLYQTANGRFKFVFAGLHNVFLASKNANSIFGHFGGPLRIRPMSQTDAYKLLSRPLEYLGFTANMDMILRLLVNTNFYPGVVHFFGAKLVEMLTGGYAEHYDDRSNPPYVLTERQIGAVMNSADLTALIEERIRWTLEADPVYMMLARCIALLYYYEDEKRNYGYKIEKILGYANDLGIETLLGMEKEVCANLLSEMCDMSILVETDGSYRFRQSRFLNIVGKSPDDIIEQIALMGGGRDGQ